MAFDQWIEAESPATGSIAVYRFAVTMLGAAGATKPADSDGSTYSPAGTQVTSGASGANGLANTSAWMRIALADGREYVFQRGTSNTLWRIKYSASAGFTGGTPSATQTPSATDQVTVFGGGTDASPTYNAWFATDNGYKLLGGADSASPYAWWMACIPNGGGSASAGFAHDPVTSASGSDSDPTVLYIGVSGGAVFGSGTIGSVSTATTTSRAASWLNYSGGSFVAMPGNGLNSGGGGTVIPSNGGSNPHDGDDNTVPVVWWRSSAQAAPYGYKGLSRILQWNPVARSAGETFTVSTTRDRVSVGDVNLPWSGAVVSL